MELEPGHVYVIPPDARMAMVDGRVRVDKRPTDGGPHMPIDYFFDSLASAYQQRAIAVVLSGTASDGTRGLEAVKAAGGITFAQDVREAKFEGMPRAAIACARVSWTSYCRGADRRRVDAPRPASPSCWERPDRQNRRAIKIGRPTT
jgi:two-component system CheB/CheR fusion protein